MEAIKISVEVNVNLSENTQNFIKSLFSNTVSINELASAIPTKPVSQTASVPAPQPTPVSKPQAAAPAQTKPAATPAPGAPAAQTASSASKGIEDVRAMLANKVNEHRDVIKQKLSELGSPSVTKLDPAKYDEMFNFLESL